MTIQQRFAALNVRIDQRLAQPEDSETDLARKRLSIYVFFVSGIATSIFGVVNIGVLPSLGWHYVFEGILIALLILITLVVPRWWFGIVVAIILFAGIIEPLYAHMISGGYTAGMFDIMWTLLGPVLAVLFIARRRFVLLIMLLGIAVFVVAALLDPIALERAPGISYTARVAGSASNLIVLLIVMVAASLFLFQQVEQMRQRADDLLLNILPAPISTRLKTSPEIIADGFEEATVLFADIVDFTKMSAGTEPIAIVNKLNEVFSDFDQLAQQYGLEKIKTIGDAYMVAAGLPDPQPDHVERTVAFAFAMLDAAGRHCSWSGEPIRLRVGINTGPVVAGVIGRHKFIYDLWGDAVNVASRMESNGVVNQIQVTQAVRDQLNGNYTFEQRGPIEVKGKGLMVTYVVTAPPA